VSGEDENEEPERPDAKKALQATRAAAVAALGQLHVQRDRLARTLANVDAKIAAHLADVEALDKALGVVG